MAKITKSEELNLSAEQADALIRNADGRVRFGVHLRGWLPHGDGSTGFEGMGALPVSRDDARRAVRSLLSPSMEARGAKIRISTSAPEEMGRTAWIWVG